MITAIVFIKTAVAQVNEVAQAIADLPAVTEVYSITGEFDLIALVRVRHHDELADVIPGGLNKVDGVSGDPDAHGLPHLLAPRSRGGVLPRQLSTASRQVCARALWLAAIHESSLRAPDAAVERSLAARMAAPSWSTRPSALGPS